MLSKCSVMFHCDAWHCYHIEAGWWSTKFLLVACVESWPRIRSVKSKVCALLANQQTLVECIYAHVARISHDSCVK